MSLGTRLTLKTAVLVLAVVVVASAALWGLGGLNRDLDEALEEYDRLREGYRLMVLVEQAINTTRRSEPSQAELARAILKIDLHLESHADAFEPIFIDTLQPTLQTARLLVDVPSLDGQALPQVVGALNTAMNLLVTETDRTAAQIRQIGSRADTRRERVVLGVSITAGLASLLAIAVGIWQYLAVMNPLRRLQRGVKRLAAGDFSDRLSATGDREFIQLANDFNRMADELATLYRDLEDKVRLRSAQLAQSERLASVGFLAAGVAHEINNPLAIIAGEAELALASLPKDADTPSRDTLTAIRDEAFRCKAITQKLLSLARPGSGSRNPTDLKPLCHEVASLVKTLPQHEGRAVLVRGDDAIVQTDASQIKQVLLNLVINALEAVPKDIGRVELIVSRSDAAASLTVRDNGKGLDAQALARVFEPFYSSKKSPTTPGLGLGLSISHAIIEDLGGRLTAQSPGLGMGSMFTIELPIVGIR